MLRSVIMFVDGSLDVTSNAFLALSRLAWAPHGHHGHSGVPLPDAEDHSRVSRERPILWFPGMAIEAGKLL